MPGIPFRSAATARGGRAWKVLAAMILLMVLAGEAAAQHYRFTRIAGGYIGDGADPAKAGMTNTIGLAIDGGGNLYVAQRGENRIRRIDAGSHAVSTYAGTGEPGYGGDGGAATDARLWQPLGLAVDGAGNLYVADAANHRIRRIDADGTIRTIAGNGTNGYAGDGGLAVDAELREPYGLALGPDGSLYFSDWKSHVVRRIDATGIIRTVAGTGTSGYAGDGGSASAAMLAAPEGVSFDAAGNLYITDSLNHRVRKVGADGTISTYAGDGRGDDDGDGGPATVAAIRYPSNVIPDRAGGMLIADYGCRIRQVSAGGTISTFAGDGTCDYGGDDGDGGVARNAQLGGVEGMAFDAAGNLYVVDASAGRVRVIDPSSTIHPFAGIAIEGSGEPKGSGAATGRMLNYLSGVAVGANGAVAFTEYFPANRAWSLDGYGTATMLFSPGSFGIFRQVSAASDGGWYVSDSFQCLVWKVERNGGGSPALGSSMCPPLVDGVPRMQPYDAVEDGHGGLLVADYRNNRVVDLDSHAALSLFAGNGAGAFAGDGGQATAASLYGPENLARDAQGNVYVGDYQNRRIRKIAPSGVITTFAGGGDDTREAAAATDARLGGVDGMAAGADGALYFADSGKVRMVTTLDTVRTVREWKGIANDVAVANDGTLYVAGALGHVYRGDPILGGGIPHDFDDDGQADLLWGDPQTGMFVLWHSADSTRAESMLNPLTGTDSRVDAIADFNGDGRVDLFWRNATTGANEIWLGGLAYQKVQVQSLGPDWRLAAAADFDGDGVADVAWQNPTTGECRLWPLADASLSRALAPMGAEWHVAGTGDFNGDGRQDMFWRNDAKGWNVVWRGGDAANYEILQGADDSWVPSVIADFDGDGRDDIFWYHGAEGLSVVWLGSQGSRQLNNSPVLDLHWKPIAAADYDGDGMADLLWHNVANGGNGLWRSGRHALTKPVAAAPGSDWVAY
jgi:sugar lactone lactonase YvrE